MLHQDIKAFILEIYTHECTIKMDKLSCSNVLSHVYHNGLFGDLLIYGGPGQKMIIVAILKHRSSGSTGAN